MDTITITQVFFSALVVLFSIILHEIAHGYAAYVQGDYTAYRARRLTLNPVPHIDVVGSVIVPLFAFLTAGTFFGWAKPVPYNIYNIRTKIGQAFVAAAGVMTNLFFAFIAGLIAYFVVNTGDGDTTTIIKALFTIVTVNLSLAFFNLIPIPPFDGMSILQSFFPRLRFGERFIYSPFGMIAAILIASVLYSMFMPYVLNIALRIIV